MNPAVQGSGMSRLMPCFFRLSTQHVDRLVGGQVIRIRPCSLELVNGEHFCRPVQRWKFQLVGAVLGDDVVTILQQL